MTAAQRSASAKDDAGSITLPTWVAEMQRSEGLVVDPETVTWMRTRPNEVKALLRRLPPHCVVRGLRPLMAPAPGHLGIVVTYRENGMVTVVHHPSERDSIPTGYVRGACDPDWLEAVAFSDGLTLEVVAAILDGEGPYAS